MTFRHSLPLFASASLLLTGCASAPTLTRVAPVSGHVQGIVRGGQQPVVGAAIQLYTVGTTAGGTSTPLLNRTITTLADGSFDITGAYSCAGATKVYLTATGGNPGLSQVNPNIAVMAALGDCSALPNVSFISIDELTTVAAVSTLAPYMTSLTAVSSANTAALAAAFTTASQLVDSTTGLAPGSVAPPSGYAIPTAQINTLADILATCINSAGGAAGDSPATPCGSLFSLTTPNATPAPTDTVTALLDLELNPTLNTPALFNLAGATPPFQPALATAPPDFRIRETHTAASAYVLQAGPSALNFPYAIVSASSASQTAIISNSGTSSLTLGTPSVTGTNSADFAQTTTCTTTLAAGASCQVKVTATPQATGNKSAYLAVTSSSPDSPQYIQLSATASASPVGPVGMTTFLSTGGTTVQNYGINGPAGASYDVQLTNVGNATLTISSVSFAGTLNGLVNSCGSSLVPGASCIASVYISSPQPDILTFATNDPNLYPTVFAGFATSNVLALSNLYFPYTAVGSTSPTRNLNLAASDIYPVLEGVNASDFGLTSNCTLSGTTVSYACTVTVSFTPSASGDRKAKLRIASGAYIPVIGTGISTAPSGNVTFSSNLLTFASVTAPQTLTLTNYNTYDISTQSLGIVTLLPVADFAQTNNCGPTLPAQSICTITVTPLRRTAGGSQALLSLTGDFGSVSATLSDHNETIYDFGTVLLGSSQTGQTFSVGGRGSSAVQGTVTGTNPGDFNGANCNGSGAGVTSCTASTTFTPTAAGLRSASLKEDQSSFTGDVVTNFFLLGTGSSTPVQALSLTAGATSISGNGPSFTVSTSATIRNLGTAAVSFTSIVGSSDATVTVTPPSHACDSIPYNGSCVLTFNVTSSVFGLIHPTLTFNPSGIVLPLVISSSFTPSVSATALAFPNTPINDVSSPMSVIIGSNGHPVAGAFNNSYGFSSVKGSCAAGENPCVLTYVFVPTAATNYALTLSVLDQTTGKYTSNYTLTGTGTVPVIPGAASVSPTSLNFPSRPVGSVSIAQTVTLSNTGSGTMNLTSTGLSGTNSGEFSYTTNCGGAVAAGANCTFAVTFAPTVSGSKTASLTINGDANAGLPLSVPINGTAQ